MTYPNFRVILNPYHIPKFDEVSRDDHKMSIFTLGRIPLGNWFTPPVLDYPGRSPTQNILDLYGMGHNI